VFAVIVVVGVAGWFLVIIGGCAYWCSVVYSLASLFMGWVGVVSGTGQAVRCRGTYLVSAVGIPWFTTSPMGPPSFDSAQEGGPALRMAVGISPPCAWAWGVSNLQGQQWCSRCLVIGFPSCSQAVWVV